MGKRIYTLEGVPNFRDFGGYETASGETVAWGRLFRSGKFAGMTEADGAVLKTFGFSQLFDLRGPREVAKFPNPQTLPVEKTHHLPIDDADMTAPGGLIERITRPNFTPEDATGYMHEIYERLALAGAVSYAQLLREAAGGASAGGLVIHCMAGKDRTGLGAALLLMILGVPREVAKADYLLSNETIDTAAQAELFRDRLREAGLPVPPHEAMRPLSGVEAAYFETALTAIETTYGDFATYVEQGIGLSAPEIDRLKARFLA